MFGVNKTIFCQILIKSDFFFFCLTKVICLLCVFFLIVNSQRKIVYIDPPLLKTEIPVRERSLLFHEESLKLSFIKKGSRKVFHLMTERPVEEQQLPPVCKRICVVQ